MCMLVWGLCVCARSYVLVCICLPVMCAWHSGDYRRRISSFEASELGRDQRLQSLVLDVKELGLCPDSNERL